MKIEKTPKDSLINQIINKEWHMFDQVNGVGGRAACQDDWNTFYIMRYSQHNALETKTLQSYLGDIIQAEHENRNLITEKYGYMMEKTDSLYYLEVLKDRLPSADMEKMELIFNILTILEKQYEEFQQKYPLFCRLGRPKEALNTTVATVMIYNFGELKTYSKETLKSYLEDISYKSSQSLMEKIQDQTAKFYGYKDLIDAEERLSSKEI